ncbi:hypothetical protein RQP46_004837 [Phenoliferia psychrophenolica]
MSNLTPIPGRLFHEDVAAAKPDHLALSPVLLGGGVFGFDYNTADTLKSSTPAETLRLCLRYGVTAIDTSPYYTIAEEVLGNALDEVRDEFPRSSYQIITKVGRYGRTKADGFDYSPERVRASVKKSMELLKTDYLDGLYCHDVEFVSEQIDDAGHAGWKVGPDGKLREEDLKRWGLADGDEATIRGPGDQRVLDAMATLFALKAEGVIRCVGFSGFPLPTLLRLARLVKAHLQPLDIMQSYCHHTLQNTTLATYIPLFEAAGVKQVISASPLSMGLLRNEGGQAWHPASPELLKAQAEAVAVVTKAGTTLEAVALGYGLASAGSSASHTPIVVGLSTPEEVHETMRVYAELYSNPEARAAREPGTGTFAGEAQKKQVELEGQVAEIIRKAGAFNWTWDSGV